MSEREKRTSATWRAVRTLEWKKKQEAGDAGPKEFGEILGEAQNVMVARWTSSGNLVSSYPPRLSEIQVQDEAYILQQFAKPEEAVKPKRGLLRGQSKSKNRGVRLLRSSASRKVRFNDDSHGRPSATGFPRSNRSSAVGSEQIMQCCKVSNALATSQSVDLRPSNQATGLAVSNKATALPAGIRYTSASRDEAAAAAEPAGQANNGATASSSVSGAATGASDGSAYCSTDKGPPAVAPAGSGAGSALPVQSVSTAGGTAAADQAFKQCQSSSGQLAVGYCSGDGGIMARFLQLQPLEPAAPLIATFLDPDSSSDGDLNKTQLADKQLEYLRNSTAPPLPKPEEPHPLGYRPLLIPDQLFEKWNTIASSGKDASSPSASSKGTAGGSRPASKRQLAADSGCAMSGGATQLVSSARRATTSTLPRAVPADVQLDAGNHAGTILDRNSNMHSCLQSATSSETASSSRGILSGSADTAISSMRRRGHRHTVDCVGEASNSDIARKSSIRSTSSNPLASQCLASTDCCSPKSHGSCSSNGGQSSHCLSSPGSFTAAAGVRQHNSSISSLPDLPDAEQVHRAADPLRAGRAAAGPGGAPTTAAGSGTGSSGKSSALKGSRMASADSAGLTATCNFGNSSRAASGETLSGPVNPLLRPSGGATWQGGAGCSRKEASTKDSDSSNGYQGGPGSLQRYQGVSADNQKTSAKRLQLPAILKPPPSTQAPIRSSRH